jgi:hypothetical protein
VRRRFDRIDGIWWRVEQLDLARSGWGNRHSGFLVLDRRWFDARVYNTLISICLCLAYLLLLSSRCRWLPRY